MYNILQTNQQNNYLDIFNVSTPNFLVRYIGTCYLPDGHIHYMSLPFNSLMHIRTDFPNNAMYIVNTIQIYNHHIDLWINLLTLNLNFPNSYCYLVSGSLNDPLVIHIPCPNENKLITNTCGNNILKTIG